MDSYAIGKDVAALGSRLTALEAKLGIGCGCSGSEGVRLAKETAQESTPGITMRPDPFSEATLACTDGHIRTVTYNGARYCQMCCGGQWQYFCWSNGTCVQPHHGPITINCAGKNWILDCV